MQGRLSPLIDNRIQCFPYNNWKKELHDASKININLIEWTIDNFTLKKNPLLTNDGIQEVMKIIKQENININSVTLDILMERPYWKKEEYEIVDIFEKIINGCIKLGIQILVLPLVDNGSITQEKHITGLIKLVDKFESLLLTNKIKIAFESDFEPYKLKKLIDKFDRKFVGVNFDTGNSASLGIAPDIEIPLLGEDILNVHIKDRLFGGVTVPLQKGACKFDIIFKELKKIKYNGNYILQTARATDNNHKDDILKYANIVNEYLQ